MAKSDVVFKLDAETGKAVSAYIKLIDAQKKTESQYKKTTGSVKKQDTAMSKAKGSVIKLAGGFLGAAGLAAGLRSVVGEIEKGITKTIEFETKISGLLNLNDNIKNSKAIKSAVLATSSATGFTTNEVIASAFDIGSGGATLTPELRKKIEQEAIEFALAEGGNPAVFAKALLTGIKVAGDEFNNDPNLLQNIFFKTVEAGRLTNAELAQRVGQILGPFIDAGFSAKEALSLIPSATALGLEFEQVTTVLRNFPGIVTTELKKKFGIDVKGKSVNEVLGILATELTGDQRAELFGRENIVISSQIIKERQQQGIDLESLRSVSPESDFIRNKFSRRLLTDKQFEGARLFKSARVSGKNTILQKDIAENSFARDFALRKRGAQEVLPGGFGGFATTLVVLSVIDQLINPFAIVKKFLGGDTVGGNLRERGVNALAFDKLQNPATKLEAQQLLLAEFGGEGVKERFEAAKLAEIDAMEKNTAIINANTQARIADPNFNTE
ncbi:MAG: phage tail tape measure protein [Candidatus Anammoxibacter sp.]